MIIAYLGALAERLDWASHPPRILDAGCGVGWLTNLVSVFGEAEGCEPVDEAIAMARTLFPQLRFTVATPGELARRPGFIPFDVVVSSEVLEHIPADLQPGFIQDLAACLRPGGSLILTTPRREIHREVAGRSEQLLENWLTERQVFELLAAAGLTAVARERALPMHSGVVDRWKARFERWTGWRRPWRSGLDLLLDHRSSLYQVWCARRR